jgi:fructose-specific phosphotransferase system component IIB
VFTNLIDSLDSSAITVTPAVIFSSDVTVENDLRANGSRVVTIGSLQSLLADSTDFADFKSRVAALLNN